MAGRISAAFYISKKIILKRNEGFDDYKWSAKNDFFGNGVTVTLDKVQYLPTFHGTKEFTIRAYLYFDSRGNIDFNYSKLY